MKLDNLMLIKANHMIFIPFLKEVTVNNLNDSSIVFHSFGPQKRILNIP